MKSTLLTQKKIVYFMAKLKPFVKRSVKSVDVQRFDEDILDMSISRFLTGEIEANRAMKTIEFIAEVPNLEWIEIIDEMREAREEIKKLKG